MDPKVDVLLSNVPKWREELELLRRIILDCHLTEEVKWGSPCYSFRKHNVVIIGGLKDCCTMGFFKGALLQDAEGIMDKPGEHTRAARTVRFTSVAQIRKLEPVLKAYIHEAIDVEKAGLKVDFAEDRDLELPEELQRRLAQAPALKKAFHALTPGRKRGYLLHFSSAKQASTREARIEKCIPLILAGKGLNDRP